MIKRKFTKKQFEDAVSKSISIAETMKRLNMCHKGGGAYRSFKSAAEQFETDFSHFKGQAHTRDITQGPKRPIDYYLKKGKYVPSHRLKMRLIKEGILERKCYKCGLTEWNNLPIPIQLDHVDGDNTNNLKENLRILCPNCHAQTDTWCGKNIEKKLNTCKNCDNKIYSNRVYCKNCFDILQYSQYDKDINMVDKKHYCKCGRKMKASSTMCITCSNKSRVRDTKIQWPPTSELIYMVSNSNYTQVGKKLGVSATSVRNRIRKH